MCSNKTYWTHVIYKIYCTLNIVKSGYNGQNIAVEVGRIVYNYYFYTRKRSRPAAGRSGGFSGDIAWQSQTAL